jgi:hypothetical protein
MFVDLLVACRPCASCVPLGSVDRLERSVVVVVTLEITNTKPLVRAGRSCFILPVALSPSFPNDHNRVRIRPRESRWRLPIPSGRQISGVFSLSPPPFSYVRGGEQTKPCMHGDRYLSSTVI